MAQTDARAGFRLPWSSDRQSGETFDGDSTTDPQAAAMTGWPNENPATADSTATATEADAPATSSRASRRATRIPICSSRRSGISAS